METIDLISFLRDYYGISHRKLSFDKITHDDIMDLFPYVKEATKEEITSGTVIGVYDKTNRIIFYQNPHLSLDKIGFLLMEDNLDKDKIIVFTTDDLENLSKEELINLRKKLSLNKQKRELLMKKTLIKKIKKNNKIKGE